jgi:hypothetical protein
MVHVAVGSPEPNIQVGARAGTNRRAQMGHTTAGLTLAIYARQMNRRDGEPERLKALVEGREWAALGSSPTESVSVEDPAGTQKPIELRA